ncbi:DUF3152 domain-containing protein [Streptomyces roseirectus]|uniref:DUF3152 domain-containing protein n=1 Tax=Streptomyces roseirectus TaxID=2768066 RepID=A0A7H0I790_9ACTN|nr:DUF3152 domain-containing protein [Streptomyces roseirectus]QNP68656.1 DUF3152 domain-containing protein [Streptomyces roseirectus]
MARPPWSLVTAHEEPRSRPRARRRRRRRRAAPRRRSLAPAVLATVAAVGGIGGVAAWETGGGTRAGAGVGSRVEGVPGVKSPAAEPPSASASASASVSASPSPSVSILERGSGVYRTAPGTGRRTGRGNLWRYKVEIEKDLGLSLTDTAAEVERILADSRGWTADGRTAFRRVSSGPADFVVRVATPATVDATCAEYGLDTRGELNCNVSHKVMVNLRRWLTATRYYPDDIPAYRALVINHEVGHFLGHGHETCPAKGAPAPAMMQQIKGLHGCVPNAWPYDRQGRRISGPSVP